MITTQSVDFSLLTHPHIHTQGGDGDGSDRDAEVGFIDTNLLDADLDDAMLSSGQKTRLDSFFDNVRG